MSVCLRLLACVAVVGVLLSGCSTTWQRLWSGIFAENAAVDRRTYRAIELKNGLNALLIHDPLAKKSAAAMDIRVGSLADPAGHQGLAHFLEHMLFLGTEKYPQVGEYDKYLAEFQGYHNAFTAREHTNYHFEVNHDGFRGALDRFGQFFISPLFNAEYVERELSAVHSEHQKNLQNDYWRTRQIVRTLYREGHPRRSFSTGDRETLKNAKPEILIDFYRKYYSANHMYLAMLSRISLDEQERLITELFSQVKNSKRAAITYSADIYAPASLPRRIEVEPVADIKQLALSFTVPTPEKYWRTKPHLLLGALVGDEGEGSLLSLLKAKGYASGLSAGTTSSSYVGEFEIKITLTEHGLQATDDIVALFFSYIAMLRKTGLSRYYFDENKKMAQTGYDFRDPPEGANAVVGFSTRMYQHPALEIIKNDSLYFEYSPADFKLFLNHIKPDTLQAMVAAKGVKTAEVEPYYGARYSVQKIPASVWQAWRKPPAAPELRYPSPNKWIPDELDVYADEKRERPYRLLDGAQGLFWFQQDTEFKLPKAQLHLHLLSARVNSDPRHKLLSLLYVRAVNESINEWKYPILMAGLSFSITPTDYGISIDMGGYADKLPQLLVAVGKKMQTIAIDDATFIVIKNKMKRDLANLTWEQAYRQAMRKLDAAITPTMIDYQEYLPLIDSVTLAAVRSYAKQVLAEAAYEGIAYGNLREKVMRAKLREVLDSLQAKPLPTEKRGQQQTVQLDKKYSYAFTTESNNNALIRIMTLGARTPKRDAILRIIDTHISAPFYTELRTKQQLGYIVHAGPHYRKKALGIRFIVQSEGFNPPAIQQRIENFLPLMAVQLAGLSTEKLADYRRSIVQNLQQPEKNIFERHRRLQAGAIKLDGNFDYRQQVIAALREITKDEVLAAWEKIISHGQLSVALFAKGKPIKTLPNTVPLSELKQLKTLPVY